MKIILSYPNKALSPNRANGKHWGSTKKIKDIARQEAYTLTKALCKKNIPNDKTPIEITYVQQDKRKRDLDNLLAASKASLDGVAMALGIDDKNFEPITLKRGFGDEPLMIVEIKELE
jgi:crossover junction endodeoxyribonuclease RusA